MHGYLLTHVHGNFEQANKLQAVLKHSLTKLALKAAALVIAPNDNGNQTAKSLNIVTITVYFYWFVYVSSYRTGFSGFPLQSLATSDGEAMQGSPAATGKATER